LYPPIIGSQFNVPITEGISNLYFVQNAKLTVQAADPTAFVGVAMVVRDVETSFNRYVDRIDDPESGNYGNCSSYSRCNKAEAFWSSDQWEMSRYGALETPTGFVPPAYPPSGIWGTSAPGCVYQWQSLNRALMDGHPLIQVQVGGGGSVDTNVDFSITLEVKMSTTPLWLGPNNCGLTMLTAPFEIPGWFSAAKAHGQLCGSGEPFGSAGLTSYPRASVALEVHPGITQSFAGMQHLLGPAKTPKQKVPLLNKIRDATNTMVETASNAWTLGKFMGHLWKSAKGFVGSGVKALRSAGPIIEEVAETAAPLLMIA
jgi:hypothetical protein